MKMSNSLWAASFIFAACVFGQTTRTIETSFRSEILLDSSVPLEIRLNALPEASYTIAVSTSTSGKTIAQMAQVPPRVSPSLSCPQCPRDSQSVPKPLTSPDVILSGGVLSIASWLSGHVPVIAVSLPANTRFSVRTAVGELFTGRVDAALIIRNGVISRTDSANFGALVLERSGAIGNFQRRLADDELSTAVLKSRLTKFVTAKVAPSLAGRNDIAIVRVETSGRVTFVGSVFKAAELTEALSRVISQWEATPYLRNGSLVAATSKVPLHVGTDGEIVFAVKPD